MALIILGLAAYANSLRGPFVFDDIPSILENESIRNLQKFGDIIAPPENSVSVAARPVLNLSFALNYAISGYLPWSYHGLNLAIHVGAALLLFGFVRRTLNQPRLRERFGEAATSLAFLIAALWVVHPLQTQAVTYVVQRGESLMGFFFLATCYTFVRGAEKSACGWLVLSVIGMVLGVATKEVMIAAPPLVWLYDRTFLSGTFRAAWEKQRLYYSALAIAALALIGSILAAGGNRAGAKGFGLGLSWWTYGLTQLEALTHYLRLSFWPFPLVFEYGATWPGPVWQSALYSALILALLAGTIVALIRCHPVGFAGAWFFIVLAPTSLTPAASQMIVEHRMYLPLAAVLAVAVLGLYAWRPRGAVVFGVVGLLAGLTLTIGRNADYHSAISLWTDTVKRRPDNGRAHGNLAQALVAADRKTEAIEHYRAAAGLPPEDPRFPYNVGVLLVETGRPGEAIEWYREALRLAPDDAKVHHNLALALAATGDLRDAAVHASVAVHLRPDDPELRVSRATYLLGLQRGLEAIAEYETALRLSPDYAAAHTNLANALLQQGRLAEALPHYERAAALTPESAEVHGNLALALLRLGRIDDARREFSRVIVLAPGNGPLVFRFGRVALQLGQPAVAIPLLTAAVQAQARGVEPRIYLAEALYKTGDFAGAANRYEEVLRVEPLNEIARTNLAVVRSKIAR